MGDSRCSHQGTHTFVIAVRRVVTVIGDLMTDIRGPCSAIRWSLHGVGEWPLHGDGWLDE